MEHETQPPKSPMPLPAPSGRKPKKRKGRRCNEVSQAQREEMARLNEMKFGVRTIAKMMGLGRKVVSRVHLEMGLIENRSSSSPAQRPKPASKLDPFKERIKEKAAEELTCTRILREIQAVGYTGGRTILADYLRENTASPMPRKKVRRRFETEPGGDPIRLVAL